MNDEVIDKKIKNTKKTIKRTFLVSIIIVLIIIFSLIKFSSYLFEPNEKLISVVKSKDNKYIVEAYVINGNATVDWAVRCYLKTDNKSKGKLIYNDYHVSTVTMTWVDDDTIDINGHYIDLPYGKYDFRDN